jgi:hypothetical protein
MTNSEAKARGERKKSKKRTSADKGSVTFDDTCALYTLLALAFRIQTNALGKGAVTVGTFREGLSELAGGITRSLKGKKLAGPKLSHTFHVPPAEYSDAKLLEKPLTSKETPLKRPYLNENLRTITNLVAVLTYGTEQMCARYGLSPIKRTLGPKLLKAVNKTSNTIYQCSLEKRYEHIKQYFPSLRDHEHLCGEYMLFRSARTRKQADDKDAIVKSYLLIYRKANGLGFTNILDLPKPEIPSDPSQWVDLDFDPPRRTDGDVCTEVTGHVVLHGSFKEKSTYRLICFRQPEDRGHDPIHGIFSNLSGSSELPVIGRFVGIKVTNALMGEDEADEYAKSIVSKPIHDHLLDLSPVSFVRAADQLAFFIALARVPRNVELQDGAPAPVIQGGKPLPSEHALYSDEQWAEYIQAAKAIQGSAGFDRGLGEPLKTISSFFDQSDKPSTAFHQEAADYVWNNLPLTLGIYTPRPRRGKYDG